jgi:hypothetical protein
VTELARFIAIIRSAGNVMERASWVGRQMKCCSKKSLYCASASTSWSERNAALVQTISTHNAGDQPVREKEIDVKKDEIENSVASHCYAMIAWKPASRFTALEEAILRHGTPEESKRVLWDVCVRGFGVPLHILGSGESNYSSAKLDCHRSIWATNGPNGTFA